MELTSRAARRHLTEEFGTRVYGGTDQVQIHSAKLMLGFLAVVCNSRGIQASVIGLYISIDEQFDGPAFVVTADSDVIFCLDSDLRITSCNPGWDRFAVDNGAPGLCGPALIERSILDCMTEPDR